MLTTLCIFVLCMSVQSSLGIVNDPLSTGRSLSDYDQDGTPLSDDDYSTAPAVRNQADCDKTAALENILEVMISMLRKDVSDNVKTALILQALTDLLKNTSAYNDEVMYKINDLVRTLDKYKKREGDEDKSFLRTGPNKVKTIPVKALVRQRKHKGKIILKYELPGFKNPHCAEALLNIIKVVYQAYESLAKSPICKTTSVSIPTLPSILDKNNIAPYIIKPESIQNVDYHLNPNDHYSKPHSDESTSSLQENYQPLNENSFPKHRIILRPSDDPFPDTKYDSDNRPLPYHYHLHPHPHPHHQHNPYHHHHQHPNIFVHQPHSKVPYSWTNGFPYDKDSESSPLNPYIPDEDTSENVKVPLAPFDESEISLIPKIPTHNYHINPQNDNVHVPWPFTNLHENPEGSKIPYKTIPTRPYPVEMKPLNLNMHSVNLQKNPEESVMIPIKSEPEGYPNEIIPDTHNYFPTGDENPDVHGPKTLINPFQTIFNSKNQDKLVKTHLKKPVVPSETIPDHLINYLYPHNQHAAKYVFEPENPLLSDVTEHSNTQILELPYHNHVTSQLNADLPNSEAAEFIPIQSLLKGPQGPDITLNPNRLFGPKKPYGPNKPHSTNNFDNLSNPIDDGTLEPNGLSPNLPYNHFPNYNIPTHDFEFDSDQSYPNKNPDHPIVNHNIFYDFTHPDQTPKRLEHPHIQYYYPNDIKPDYPDSETQEPIYDLKHSDETLKHPLSTLIPHQWQPTGSETPTPGYPAPYMSDPTTPPKTDSDSSVKVIGFIRDAIEVIEGLIPAVKFDQPTLVIIAKIKNILVQKDTDINDDEFGTILKLYKKLINYVKRLNEYQEIIDYIDLPRVTNLSKLETEKVVELTYMVKRPQPLIYYPYYYVKYKLPYTSLVLVKNLLKNKPHLRMNPQKLYKELLADSEVDETSPDLNNLKKNDLLKLTVDTGSLVNAKVVNGNEELNEQLNVLREITSEALLNTNNTTFTISKLETENGHEGYGVNIANNDLSIKENKHNEINNIRWNDKQNEQFDSSITELLRGGSTMINYGNFPGAYTPAEADLDFTTFDSDKLRSDVLRGENVGLPYSDYVMPTDVSPLEGVNEPIAKPSQGPTAPVMNKLIEATLKASSNSRLRDPNQHNFLNNGGLVSSDSDQISLNTGTGNSQTGVSIISPKIMINQASINHAVTNSDVTETKVESNNQQNSVNTAIAQGNHQDFVKQNNIRGVSQQNYLNLGGLVSFNHQNISLNAGAGNLQDNVSYISPEFMLNDIKHEDNIDHTRTSKAPIDSLNANFKPDSDLTKHQESMGDINVTSSLGLPIDYTYPEGPNKYGQSGIGSGNIGGIINDNPENIKVPITNDNLPNAGTKYPDLTNAQEISDMITNSVKEDVSQYTDSGAGKEIQNTYQNTENPNHQNIYNNPITTNTPSNQHESYSGTIPQSTLGLNSEPLNSANQGIYGPGPGTWKEMGQSIADNHHSGDLNWRPAAGQQDSRNLNLGVLANQQSLGYDLGLLSQQNVKGYNLGALTNQQNLGGYNFGALDTQTGYNMGVLANQQNLGAVSNHRILGGYNGAQQYNLGGYSAAAGQGLGFQVSQQNIANFGAGGGASGHQVNYMFQSMPLYYKRPLVPTRVTLITPSYSRPVSVVG